MNILPLVLTLLFVIGVISMAEFNRASSLSLEKGIFEASSKGSRAIYNHLREREYLAEGGEEEEEKGAVYFRTKRAGTRAALNLTSLLEDKTGNSPLFSLVRNYLGKLYKEILPKKEKEKREWMREFFKVLFAAQTKALDERKGFLPLCQVAFPQKGMRFIYCKMLRGTNPYDMKKGEGYPPLERIVCFENDHQFPIAFNCAPPCLLEEIFGKRVAEVMMQKEQELVFDEKRKKERMRNTPLRREEIQKIYSDLSLPLKEELLSLLNYFFRGEDSLVWQDEKTHMMVFYDE